MESLTGCVKSACLVSMVFATATLSKLLKGPHKCTGHIGGTIQQPAKSNEVSETTAYSSPFNDSFSHYNCLDWPTLSYPFYLIHSVYLI